MESLREVLKLEPKNAEARKLFDSCQKDSRSAAQAEASRSSSKQVQVDLHEVLDVQPQVVDLRAVRWRLAALPQGQSQ